MAAGLYIHILDEIDDQLAGTLAASTEWPFLDPVADPVTDKTALLTGRLGEAPRVLVGDGPWGVTDAAEHPVPAPLARIRETVTVGPSVVDDDYIAQILIPFDQPAETPYRLGRPGEIWRFLRHHEGKHALLAIRPEEATVAAEPVAAADADQTDSETAAPVAEVASEPVSDALVPHDPAFRRPVPTIDGVRPLALVLVTTQQRSAGSATLKERILAALATIGTFGAGLAAGAGLNNLIR